MVDGRLNLNCKFSSSLQKIVIFNILIAFIFTTLLLKIGQRLKDGSIFFFIFFLLKKVRFNVTRYRQRWYSFFFLHYKMASLLLCCFAEEYRAVETWSRGRSSTER